MLLDYVVNLEQFYGPLDLLLYLVEKDEMNIYDIPIAVITDQYMQYITGGNQIDLDQIGDFLMMASYLLSLKARMLLPTKENENEAEEPDPRQELIHKLIAYQRYKKAAELLALRLDEDYPRPFFRHGRMDLIEPSRELAVSLQSLLHAYVKMGSGEAGFDIYNVPRGDVSVSLKMDEIMQHLQMAGQVNFQSWCATCKHRREILASFLAVLELIRLRRIDAIQDTRFGQIILRIQELQ
jgi:segregation and condensation protein A